jgi:tetratricopeptide (TPR) repeat protein
MKNNSLEQTDLNVVRVQPSNPRISYSQRNNFLPPNTTVSDSVSVSSADGIRRNFSVEDLIKELTKSGFDPDRLRSMYDSIPKDRISKVDIDNLVSIVTQNTAGMFDARDFIIDHIFKDLSRIGKEIDLDIYKVFIGENYFANIKKDGILMFSEKSILDCFDQIKKAEVSKQNAGEAIARTVTFCKLVIGSGNIAQEIKLPVANYLLKSKALKHDKASNISFVNYLVLNRSGNQQLNELLRTALIQEINNYVNSLKDAELSIEQVEFLKEIIDTKRNIATHSAVLVFDRAIHCGQKIDCRAIALKLLNYYLDQDSTSAAAKRLLKHVGQSSDEIFLYELSQYLPARSEIRDNAISEIIEYSLREKEVPLIPVVDLLIMSLLDKHKISSGVCQKNIISALGHLFDRVPIPPQALSPGIKSCVESEDMSTEIDQSVKDQVDRYLDPLDESEIEKFVDKLFKQALSQFPEESVYAMSKILRHGVYRISQEKFDALISFFKSDISDRARSLSADCIEYAIQSNTGIIIDGLSKCLGYDNDDKVLDIIAARESSPSIANVIPAILKRIAPDSAYASKVVGILQKTELSEESTLFLNQVALLNNDNLTVESALSQISELSNMQSVRLDKLIKERDLNSILEYCRKNTASRNCFEFILQNLNDAVPILQTIVERNKQPLPDFILSALVEMLPTLKSETLDLMNKIIRQGKSSMPKDIISRVFDGLERGNYQLVALLDSLISQNKDYIKNISERHIAIICNISKDPLYCIESINVLERISQEGICIDKNALGDLAELDLDPNILVKISKIIQRNYYLSQNISRVTNSYSRASAFADEPETDLISSDSVRLIKCWQEIVNARNQIEVEYALNDIKTILEHKKDLPEYIIQCLYDVIASNSGDVVTIAQDILRSALKLNVDKCDLDIDKMLHSQRIDNAFIETLAILATRGNVNTRSLNILLYYSTFLDIGDNCSNAIEKIPSDTEIYQLVEQYHKLLESNNELEALEAWSKQNFYIGRNGIILLDKISVDPKYANLEYANRVFSILQENEIFNVSDKLYDYLQSYAPEKLGAETVTLEQGERELVTDAGTPFDEHFLSLVEKLKQIKHLSGDALITIATTLKNWASSTVDTFIDMYSQNSASNLLLVKNLTGIEDALIQQSFYELTPDSNDVGDLVKAASRMSMRVSYCGELSLNNIDRLVDLGYSYKDIEVIRANSGEQFAKVIANIVDYGVSAKDTNYKNQTLLDIVESCESDSILHSVIEMSLEVSFKGSVEKDLDTLLKEIKKNDETIDIADLRNKYDQIIHCHNTQDSILYPIGKPIKDWSKEDIKAWSAAVKGTQATEQNLVELIAVIKRANIVAEGKDPRATQVLSTLLMYQNPRSTLLQIATGEGKTTIVAMLAAAKVLQGEKVDVITSSSILATDGATKKQDFYGTLGLSVGDNALDKKSCYVKDIVYGSLDNFQYDFLKDQYKLEGIRQERPFSTVIVDEVDSMLVDEGSKIAMLSENIAGMEYLELMLATIFMTTIRFVKGFTGERDPQTGNLVFCDPASKEEEPTVLLVSDTMEFVKSNVKEVIQDRYFSQKVCSKKEEDFIMPANLKAYAEKQLDKWVEMSILATQQHEKVDYIIKDGEIKPIDKNNTGIVQTNMSWQNGLHQFLQIKHGLRISPESFTTCFVSNVSYFKKYGNNIYGMTGTLGSEESKKLLSEVYNVSCASVPTYKQKQFIELTPIIAHEESAWINGIVDSTRNALDQNRAVLIICRSMEDVDTVEQYLQVVGSIDPSKIQKYSDNTSDKGIDGEKITSGRVIIATNLAGRGTDINADEIEPYGGLHVCLTFLPSNLRVEEQALGRTARQGKKGTGQLIIKSSIDNIREIKQLRDEGEKERLENIRSEELKTISIKDELFLENFMPFVVEMRKKSKDKNIIKAIEERWGLFLSTLELDKDSEKLAIIAKYNNFIKDMTRTENDIRNGCYHALMGNDLCDGEKYAEAIDSYEKAIQLDPALEYIAHYNKAFAIIKKSGDADAAKIELDAALKIIDEALIPQLDGLGAVALMCYNHFSDNPNHSQTKKDEIQTDLQAQIVAKKELLEQHRAYISQALNIIQNKKKDSTIEIAEVKCLEDIYESNRPMKEILELRNHGLRHLFVVKEKPPVNIWGIIGVFLLGALQVIGGAALTLVGFANVGMGLIGEGVGDFITGIRSAITGEFDWGQYLKDKAISLAISVVMMGCSAIKNAVKAAGSIKGAIKASIASAKELGKKAVAKLTGQSVQSAVLNEAAKEIGKEATRTLTKEGMKAVGKVVLKEFVEQGVIELINYGVSKAIEAAIDEWQNEIAARVRRELNDNLDKASIASAPVVADQIANSFINKRDGILQEFGSRFAMVAGKHLVARKGGLAAVAANIGAATIVSAMGWSEQDQYTAKFCAEINEKMRNASGKTAKPKQEAEGEQKSAALVTDNVGSMIDNWAKQITDKIKSIIKNQMVSPWTNLAVAQGVKHASNHVQKSFSSQGHTFDDKLKIWQAKNSQYVNAQKIAAGRGNSASARTSGQAPDSNREMDMHDIAITSRNENVTIVVRDENGKPIGVFGNGTKTVELERTPAKDGTNGHFKLKGMDDRAINPSGPNMCGFDSIGHALGKDPHELKASASISRAADDNKYARNIRSAQETLGSMHQNSDKAKNAMMMGGVKPDSLKRDPNSKHPRDAIVTLYRGVREVDPNTPISAKDPKANISELEHLVDTTDKTQFNSATTEISKAKEYAKGGKNGNQQGKVITMEIPVRINSDETWSFEENGSIKTKAQNLAIRGRPGNYDVRDCTEPEYVKERMSQSQLNQMSNQTLDRNIKKGSSSFQKPLTGSQILDSAKANSEVLITGLIMPSEIKDVSSV